VIFVNVYMSSVDGGDPIPEMAKAESAERAITERGFHGLKQPIMSHE
jgi:hypothetical protein